MASWSTRTAEVKEVRLPDWVWALPRDWGSWASPGVEEGFSTGCTQSAPSGAVTGDLVGGVSPKEEVTPNPLSAHAFPRCSLPPLNPTSQGRVDRGATCLGWVSTLGCTYGSHLAVCLCFRTWKKLFVALLFRKLSGTSVLFSLNICSPAGRG